MKTAKSSWFIELGDSSLSRLRAQGARGHFPDPGSRWFLISPRMITTHEMMTDGHETADRLNICKNICATCSAYTRYPPHRPPRADEKASRQ